jgi:hypothetical protein
MGGMTQGCGDSYESNAGVYIAIATLVLAVGSTLYFTGYHAGKAENNKSMQTRESYNQENSNLVEKVMEIK